MNQDRRRSLLENSLPALWAHCRRIAGDRQLARELLQEVSVRMLAGEGPSDPRRFLAWGCGIARHVLSHGWRMRERLRVELPLEGDLAEELCAPTASDPEDQVDARAWMARAVVEVDREGLELLVRRYVLEETGEELAGQLAQSSAALRMRLMRLRSSLSAARQVRWGPARPVVTPPAGVP
jgi:RNA polymerase sigma factor (sigma-70 family)